jgi:hypothetical protein
MTARWWIGGSPPRLAWPRWRPEVSRSKGIRDRKPGLPNLGLHLGILLPIPFGTLQSCPSLFILSSQDGPFLFILILVILSFTFRLFYILVHRQLVHNREENVPFRTDLQNIFGACKIVQLDILTIIASIIGSILLPKFKQMPQK